MNFVTLFLLLFSTSSSLAELVIRPADWLHKFENQTKTIMAIKEIAVRTGDDGCDWCWWSMVIKGPEVIENSKYDFYQN